MANACIRPSTGVRKPNARQEARPASEDMTADRGEWDRRLLANQGVVVVQPFGSEPGPVGPVERHDLEPESHVLVHTGIGSGVDGADRDRFGCCLLDPGPGLEERGDHRRLQGILVTVGQQSHRLAAGGVHIVRSSQGLGIGVRLAATVLFVAQTGPPVRVSTDAASLARSPALPEDVSRASLAARNWPRTSYC